MKQDVALHTDADSMNINNNNKVVQGPAWKLYFYQQTANDNIISYITLQLQGYPLVINNTGPDAGTSNY